MDDIESYIVENSTTKFNDETLEYECECEGIVGRGPTVRAAMKSLVEHFRGEVEEQHAAMGESPQRFADTIREIADGVEAGTIESFALVFVERGERMPGQVVMPNPAEPVHLVMSMAECVNVTRELIKLGLIQRQIERPRGGG